MNDFWDILDGFEKALELERELGTRTVECDRALLIPMRPEAPGGTQFIASTSAGDAARTKPGPPVAAAANDTPVPVGGGRGATALPGGTQFIASTSAADAARTKPGPPAAPSIDFLFVGDGLTGTPTDDPAQALFAKMVAALKRPPDTVRVAGTADWRGAFAAARPRCVVVMGSDAAKAVLPGVRVARGMWYATDGVPTVVTFHPSRILLFAGTPDSLKKAKTETWNTLKAALARVTSVRG